MKVLGVVITTWFVLVSAPAFAADGSDLYAKNCASCHGLDAKAGTPAAAAMKVPAIAGHDAGGTVETIRTNPKHKTQSGKFDDDQLKALADYLAGL